MQASAYKSGEVVNTLKKAFMPPAGTPGVGAGGTTMVFQNEDAVLNYIGSQVLLPIWVDPVCGDGVCESPWEFPAWGNFGCRAGGQRGGAGQRDGRVGGCNRVTVVNSPNSEIIYYYRAWTECTDAERTRMRGGRCGHDCIE